MPPHDYEPTIDHSAENIKTAVEEWLNDHPNFIKLSGKTKAAFAAVEFTLFSSCV